MSLVLVAACAVFVAAEFALLAADRPTVERLAESGDAPARGVLTAFRTLSTQLSGVQVGITVTNLAIGLLAEPAVAGLLHGPLRSIGLTSGEDETVAVVVALVVSTVVTMLLGELVPKNLAIAAPVAVARAVQLPVRTFTRAALVPIRALNGLASFVLRRFGLEPQEELASARSPDELISLVRHSAREGTLPARTATLLTRALTFGDRQARDVMTPRRKMITVEDDDTVAAVLETIRATGRSRLPVTDAGDVDRIVGTVDLDRAIAVPRAQRARTTVGRIHRPVVEVPQTLPLDDVLRMLQAASTQIAVVVDEYGGTAGLLTGEDLLEELVGDVEDEHDTTVPAIRRDGDTWDVAGLARPDEIRATTGHALPESGPYETVAGLVMHRLGRIPAAGDVVRAGDVELTVCAMDGRRIERLTLRASEPAGNPAEGTAP